MTDKEKIRAEVERLKMEYDKESIFRTVRGDTAREVFGKLLSFIDSIPEEPVNEDLDDEIVDWCNHLDYVDFDYEAIRDAARHIANWQKQKLMNELWHKGTDNPGNQHPYPVINPDTQEMTFAYYNQRLGWWEFNYCDYNPGRNMLWLDIEKILPNLPKGGAQ
jgi:hypothetical protein